MRKHGKDLLGFLETERLGKVSFSEHVSIKQQIIQIWKDKALLLAMIVLLVILIPCYYLVILGIIDLIHGQALSLRSWLVFIIAVPISFMVSKALTVFFRAAKRSVITDKLPALTIQNICDWFTSEELDEYIRFYEEEVLKVVE